MPRIPRSKLYATEAKLRLDILRLKRRMEQVKLRRLEYDTSSRVIPFFTPIDDDDMVKIRRRPDQIPPSAPKPELENANPPQPTVDSKADQTLDDLLTLAETDDGEDGEDILKWCEDVRRRMKIEMGDVGAR